MSDCRPSSLTAHSKDLDSINSTRLSQESPLPLYCPLRLRQRTGRGVATTSGVNNKAFVPDPGFMSTVSVRETTRACVPSFKEDKMRGPS